jgi:hypothetical protein
MRCLPRFPSAVQGTQSGKGLIADRDLVGGGLYHAPARIPHGRPELKSIAPRRREPATKYNPGAISARALAATRTGAQGTPTPSDRDEHHPLHACVDTASGRERPRRRSGPATAQGCCQRGVRGRTITLCPAGRITHCCSTGTGSRSRHSTLCSRCLERTGCAAPRTVESNNERWRVLARLRLRMKLWSQALSSPGVKCWE